MDKKGFTYRKLQQNVRFFRGMSYAEICEFGLDRDEVNWISNGMAANLFREHGDSLDRLTPLERFLGSRVGLQWNAVEGEIRSKIKGRGDSVRHVLGHVDDFVERLPILIDGVVYRNPSTSYYSLYPLRTGDFYVNPEDGTLCKVLPCCHLKQWRRTPKPIFDSAMLNGKEFLLVDRRHWTLPWSNVDEFGWYLFGTTVTYKEQLVVNPDGTPQFDEFGAPVLEYRKIVDGPKPLRKASLKEAAALEKLRNATVKRKTVGSTYRVSQDRRRRI
jgi:hypothetical protein